MLNGQTRYLLTLGFWPSFVFAGVCRTLFADLSPVEIGWIKYGVEHWVGKTPIFSEAEIGYWLC